MKKIFAVCSMFVLCLGTLLFGGCGDIYKDVSIQASKSEIVLTLDDGDNSFMDFEINIKNYSKNKHQANINFSIDKDVAIFSNQQTFQENGITKIRVAALRSGTALITATMLDGGAKVTIPIVVKEKLQSISVNESYKPYVIKGGEFTTFDVSKIIKYYPDTTIDKDLILSINEEPITGLLIDADDLRTSVEVTATSKEYPEIFTSFNVRLISPITSIKSLMGGEEIENVELAINHSTKSSAIVSIDVYCEEENVSAVKDIIETEYFTAKLTEKIVSNGVHTFKYEIISRQQSVDNVICPFTFKIDGVEYTQSKDININVVKLPQKILINGEDIDNPTIKAFNYNTSISKGTKIQVDIIPDDSNSLLQYITLTYDDTQIKVYSQNKTLLVSGTTIIAGNAIYVKGAAGFTGNSTISLVCDIPEEYGDDLIKNVSVSVFEGVTEISGKNAFALTLSPDGTANSEVYYYTFSVLPAGAYLGGAYIENRSAIATVELDTEFEGRVLVYANGVGQASFTIVLPNGIEKTIYYQIISPLDQSTLFVDAPSTISSAYVGEKIPNAVGVDVPLEKLAIHRSLSYEKAVPLKINYYPSNASIQEIKYDVSNIESESNANVVEIYNNSLIGRNVGKAKVKITISYAILNAGSIESNEKIFEFDVEVYIPVSSFNFTNTNVTVADLNTVGFFKIEDATANLKTLIYPTNATNGAKTNIVYSLSQGEVDPKDSNIINNSYISFNKSTLQITGQVEEGVVETSPSYITATLTDYSNIYTIRITVNVKKYEPVRAIVVDNVPGSPKAITLSATHPNFQILAHALDSTAYNRALTYEFIPTDEQSAGLISISPSGLVTLQENDENNVSGYIRIAAQDSYKDDSVNPSLYVDIFVSVEAGTRENPFVIKTKEDLLAVNTEEALSKHYVIDGTINLSGEEFSPLGVLTGSISGGKIIGLKFTKAMTIDEENLVGLFASVAETGEINNVLLECSYDFIGSANAIGSFAGVNNGLIKNCSAIIDSSEISVSGPSKIGGIAGINNGQIITVNWFLGLLDNGEEDVDKNKVTLNGVTYTIFPKTLDLPTRLSFNNKTYEMDSNNTLSLIGYVYTYDEIEGTLCVFTNQTNFDLVRSKFASSTLTVNSEVEQNVYVGGIVGENSNTGVIARSLEAFTLYNNYGYSVNLSIIALNATGLGGAIGLNRAIGEEHGVYNLATCGFVKGSNSVGGFVGINEGNCETSLSNTFASGKNNVGGFVGNMQGGTIKNCLVEVYYKNEIPTSETYLVSGNNYVGGFVGFSVSGSFDTCSAITYRNDSRQLVRVTPLVTPSFAGAFSASTAATFTTTYSNFEVLNETGFTISPTIVDNSGTAPAVADEITIVVNEDSKLSEGDFGNLVEGSEEVAFFVMIPQYTESGEPAEYLNFSSFMQVTPSSGIEISSLTPSVVSFENGFFRVLKTGTATMRLQSKYNSTLKKDFYVFVVDTVTSIVLSQTIEDFYFALSDDSIVSMRKGTTLEYDKSIYGVIDDNGNAINLNHIDNVTIRIIEEGVEEQNFTVSNYENLISIYAQNAFKTDLENGKGIKFVAVISETIGSKTFVSQLPTDVFMVSPTVNVYEGTKSINLEYSNISITPSDVFVVNLDIDTDFESEMISIDTSKKVYIDGVLISPNQKNKISFTPNTNGKISFSVEVFDKHSFGEFSLSFTDAANMFKKYLTINVLKQTFNQVDVSFFQLPDNNNNYTPSKISVLTETKIIVPGKPALIKIEVAPEYARFDELEISNVLTNSRPITFEFSDISEKLKKKSGAILTPNGIKLNYSTLINVGNNLETIYIKALVTTLVENNAPLDIEIKIDGVVVKTLRLFTEHVAGVKLSIEGSEKQANGSIYLAKGLDYKLNTLLVGYTLSQIIFEVSNLGHLTYYIEDGQTYLRVAKQLTYPSGQEGVFATISAYGLKIVNGTEQRSETDSLSFILVDYVIRGIGFEGGQNVGDAGQIASVVYRGSYSLNIDLINNRVVEYDATNPNTVRLINTLCDTLSRNIMSFKYRLTPDGEWQEITQSVTNSMFMLSIDGIIKIVPVYVYSNYTQNPYAFKFDTTFVYDQGRVSFDNNALFQTFNFSQTITLSIFQLSSEDSMIPITTYDELINMQAGQYYILLDDIVLPSTFTPITTVIAGFDGNSKSIKFTSGINIDADVGVVYFGLFEQINENTIIQNVNVTFDSVIIALSGSEVYFGFIAGKNNGVITNCSVKGGGAEISLSEPDGAVSRHIAGITGENEGYVTNSRVSIGELVSKGDMAGITPENAGTISSCYVKETSINNYSSNTLSRTAGIAAENRTNGQILGSYVEGIKTTATSFNCDGNYSIRSNSSIGGFVYENSGKIYDSYSDIKIVSASVVGGFVYQNLTSGIISNCYSTSQLLLGVANNFPFIAEINSEVLNSGTLSYCYYYDGSSSVNNSPKIQGLTKLTKAQFAAGTDTFVTFGFASSVAPNKGIWIYNNVYKPELVAANNIVVSNKTYGGSSTDEASNAVEYYYYNMPDGSINNPYIIKSALQFEEYVLANASVNSTVIQSYRIVADLDYSDEETGKELSELYTVNFCGQIEGNGMNVENFTISSTSALNNAGFFASVGSVAYSSTITCLNFYPKLINLPVAKNVGVVAGTLYGSGLFNINVDTFINGGTMVLNGVNKVGGIVGFMQNNSQSQSKLINCSAAVSVNATSIDQSSDESKINSAAIYVPSEKINFLHSVGFAGGLVGYIESGSIYFGEVKKTVSIIGQITGGVVGYNGYMGIVQDCVLTSLAAQSIRASYAAGGVVGLNRGMIIDSYPTGNTDGLFKSTPIAAICVGGVAGLNEGTIKGSSINKPIVVMQNIDSLDFEFVGGIVGSIVTGTIENTIYCGRVQGKLGVGGIVGRIKEGGSSNIFIQNNAVGKNITGSTNVDSYPVAKIHFEGDVASIFCGPIVGKRESNVRLVYSENSVSNNTLFTIISYSINSTYNFSDIDYDTILTTIEERPPVSEEDKYLLYSKYVQVNQELI